MQKRDNFDLAYFTLSETIWVCDLGTGKETFLYFNFPLISMILQHTECAVKKNLNLLVVAFGPICMLTMCF
jgi:hypothetical protein